MGRGGGAGEPERREGGRREGEGEGLEQGQKPDGVAGPLQGREVHPGRGQGVGEVPRTVLKGGTEVGGGAPRAVGERGRGGGGQRGRDVSLPQGHLDLGAQRRPLLLRDRREEGVGGAVGLVLGEREPGQVRCAALLEGVERRGEVGGEAFEVRLVAALDMGHQVAEVDACEVGEVLQHRGEVDGQPERVAVAAQIAGHRLDLLVGEGPDRGGRQHDLDVRRHQRLGHGQVREQVAGDGRDLRVDEHVAVEAVVRRLLVQHRLVEAGRGDRGPDGRGQGDRRHAQDRQQEGEHRHETAGPARGRGSPLRPERVHGRCGAHPPSLCGISAFMHE